MRQTTATARRTVLIALGGAAIVILGVVLERMNFERAQRAAMQDLLEADRAVGEILLADERRTMAARMAVATGEQRWIDRYDRNISRVEDALGRMSKLSASIAPGNFDTGARTANSRLLMQEGAAFRELRAGDANAARRLLQSGLYEHHKQQLLENTSRFFHSTVESARSRLLGLQKRTEIALPLVIVAFGLGAYFLWLKLNEGLSRLQRAFIRGERQVRDQAMKDPLTGLFNRRAFFARLRDATRKAHGSGEKLALFMVDLDRFKPVNDRNGHLAGDHVLKEVGARLSAVLPDAKVLARYGGDEFVALVGLDSVGEDVQRVARRMLAELKRPMCLDGVELDVGATLGSAMFPRDATTDEDFIRKADLAMRNAKQQARGTYQAYCAKLEADKSARPLLEAELRQAIVAGTLTPYFQPLVDLRSGQLQGFEVLCRWHHPRLGLLLPAEFVPVAQSAGLIGDMTMALLRTVCERAQSLPDTVSFALNLAPQQIENELLADEISAVLAETGLAAERLQVEITEHALVNDLSTAKQVINSLNDLGVKVALDDFGTGYSSLYHLSELPINVIKIDRSFVSAMHEREESNKIVVTILNLAKSLRLESIAEGVQTERDVSFLKANGCVLAQGSYFGMPMPLDEAVVHVRKRGLMGSQQLVA
jgi:diguanylate cyclase (GGDEF)-like protein